jgi:RNA polymerase sigma-70 factor (ECF subfamily)
MQHDDDPGPMIPLPGQLEPEPSNPIDPLTEFSRFRGLLFSIAYRMLGSVADAEDILQEAFIRWHRASDVEIRSTRAFLVTVVSRLCISQLQSARVQREEYVGQWLPEPLVTESRADPFTISQVDESLSMAFLVLLERLAPVERAVFLLREVFDYEYSEIAQTVGKNEANCRQILRRARQHMAEIRPRFKASTEQRRQLLTNFMQATATGDLDRLVALLSSDAALHSDGGGRAPAVPNLVCGADNVARAIIGGLRKLVPTNLTTRIAQINGEPGLVSYVEGRPFSVLTLHVAGDRIKSIYIVTNPEKLAHLAPLPAPPC